MNQVAHNLESVSSPMVKTKHKPYSTYRDSGIEWLGEIPVEWNLVRLRYQTRINPTKSEIIGLSSDTEVSFVPMEAVCEYGGMSTESTKILEEVDQGYTYFQEGDVVVAKITPCFENGKGSLAYGLRNGVGFGTTELHVMRAINNLDARYLFYLSISDPFRRIGASEMYGAGGQKRVPESFIKDLKLFIPDKTEQQSIADFLDEKTAKIDALVEKKQRLIELLKEKRTALINHTVTKGLDPNAKMKASRVGLFGNMPDHWKEKRFGYLVSFNKGLNITKENLQDDGIPCISYGEIHSKYGFEVNPEKDELKYVSETYIESSKNALLKHGDFIFADTSEDIEGSGNFTYYNSNATAFAGYHTIIAKPASNNEPRYLAYLFDSSSFRAQIRKEVTGTKVFSITNSILKDAVVLLPPIPEQQVIVSYLDKKTSQIDVLVNKVLTAIDKLKEYRTALISAAVTGKIDVRGN